MRQRVLIEALAGICLAAAVFSGCATVQPAQEAAVPVFYPQPPGQPRLQLLAGFSSSSDLTGRPGWFKRFVVGEPEDRPIVKPYGFDFWEDQLYVCDTVLAGLVVLDFGTKAFRYVSPSGPGRLVKPINLAIDENGTKYIADAGRGEVVILDRQDRFAGTLARQPGLRPTDVAIDGDRLLVAELKNKCVEVWDRASRRYLFSIPAGAPASAEARLFSPANVAVDREGNLFVSDLGAFRVAEFDREGRFLRSFGSQGDAPGQFARPKGLDLDDEGRLYVVDAAAEVVQIFDRQGNLLLFFGQPEAGVAPLSLPAKVRLNTSLLPYFERLADPSFALEYLVFVSSQYGERKISVFGFGASK